MKARRRLISVLDETVHDAYMLSVPDLAAVLNVDVSAARSYLATGKIRGGIHIGKLWRICAGDLRAYFESEKLPKNSTVANIREATRRRRTGG
jgi:hypothetical protein